MANYCYNFCTLTANKKIIQEIITNNLKQTETGFEPITESLLDFWFDMDITTTDSTIELGFDSKWSPPVEQYAKIRSQYPELKLHASYYEPASSIAGQIFNEAMHEYAPNTKQYREFVYQNFLDEEEEWDTEEYHPDLQIKTV